jgi:hypothetical protein
MKIITPENSKDERVITFVFDNNQFIIIGRSSNSSLYYYRINEGPIYSLFGSYESCFKAARKAFIDHLETIIRSYQRVANEISMLQ